MVKFITPLLFAIFAFFARAQGLAESVIQPQVAKQVPCPTKPSQICPMYVTAMCVYPKSGAPYAAESNPCIVCQNTNIAATSMGICPSNTAAPLTGSRILAPPAP